MGIHYSIDQSQENSMPHIMSRIAVPTRIVALIASLTSTMAQGADDMSVEEIENGFRVNAALAQFHRWFLLYEEPRYGIANQLDILADDIRVVSGLGEAQGHDAYAARVAQLPSTWQNAHRVNAATVTVAPDGTLSLIAEVTYLNAGMLEDGGIRMADLTYQATLAAAAGDLPKFTTIAIDQNADGQAEAFVPAYGENRMRSLAHYWFALIEDPARDPEPVREILSEEFSLNFSSGAITDFDGFKAWLAGPASSVVASTHKISAFAQERSDDGTYRVTMTLDWNGILPDGTELAAKTGHTWHVIDDPTQRFARIKTMDVVVLEPFQPKAK